jgi:hypothetical protein
MTQMRAQILILPAPLEQLAQPVRVAMLVEKLALLA